MSTALDQVKSYVRCTRLIGDAIREARSVPSGHLYAQLMGHMTLPVYQRIIDMLKRAELVREQSHELIWIGPLDWRGPSHVGAEV